MIRTNISITLLDNPNKHLLNVEIDSFEKIMNNTQESGAAHSGGGVNNNSSYRAAMYTNNLMSDPNQFKVVADAPEIRKFNLSVFIGGTVLVVLLVGIIMIILFGTIPCSLIPCRAKFSICVNYPFKPVCECAKGYNGDGSKYCDECGLVYNTQNVRVVGGVEAVPHSWPSIALMYIFYQADVIISTNETVNIDVKFQCAATLIDRETLITAAHCIVKSFEYEIQNEYYMIDVETNKYYPTLESMYKIYLGIHNQSETFSVDPYTVRKIFVHEDYNDVNNLNDIAILKLNEPVKLNKNVQPACVPEANSKNYPDTEGLAWIMGWGVTTEDGELPNSLQNARISLYNSTMCDEVLPEDTKNWDSQICAGEVQGGKDTCQGDSGGPIFVLDKINNKMKYVDAGVVSYGDGCAQVGKPGIYTKLAYYMNWIKSKSIE